MKQARQPWIYSSHFDLAFILAPAFLVSFIVILCPSVVAAIKEVPLWAWVVLVMGIDVSHVYSTLFRTYFDPEEMEDRRALYLMVPVMCWFAGVLLYSMGALVFWRVLAYVAVYHFIRQQYGFMMIYRRKEAGSGTHARRIDQAVIYLSTLYPIIYWHTHLPRHFAWFVDGDFVSLQLPMLERFTWGLYLVLLGLYLAKEIRVLLAGGTLNIPKNLLLLGTALSWYIGIVAFDGDMAFTLTNVVTHGIPYMALVWAYGRKKWGAQESKLSPSARLPLVARAFSSRSIPLFCGVLLLLGYLEEALWDGLVWRENGAFFRGWHTLPAVTDNSVLVWLVPLLVVPQATHYVVDGFIWKLKKPDPSFSKLLKEA